MILIRQCYVKKPAFAGFFVHLKGWFSGISGSGS